MAQQTDNIKLILPDNSEYTDIWDKPVNDNFVKIDTEIGNVKSEVHDARGSESSMATRLNVALNQDGSLKDVPAIAKASTSPVYGNNNSFGDAFDLNGRIGANDFDNFYAKSGDVNLQAFLARMSSDWISDSVVSASTNYLTFTGAVVTANGSITPVYANINGFLSRVRIQSTVTVSGAAGQRWFALQRNPNGVVLTSDVNGSCNQYPATTGPLIKFKDATKNFVTLGVKPGDILKVTSPVANKGYYTVKSTNTEDSNCAIDELFINGQFGALGTAVNYQVIDPYAATLLVESAAHSPVFQRVSNKIYIGVGSFDGTNMTSITQYALKGKYEEWQAVTLVSNDYNNTFAHKLGYMPRKVYFYAASTNDYLSPLFPLGVASGASGLERNVIVELTQTQIQAKNPISGLYYKDYSGVSQTSGFMLMIAER
jgi:hypothetical protein